MAKIYTIEEIKNIAAPIAKKHKVTKMYLFGSYARGEADEESDIDFCIDGRNLTDLLLLGALYAELEEALGKSLDIITTQQIKQNINSPRAQKLVKNIRKDKQLIYEEEAKN